MELTTLGRYFHPRAKALLADARRLPALKCFVDGVPDERLSVEAQGGTLAQPMMAMAVVSGCSPMTDFNGM